jgi:hypothetical protein
MMIQRMQKLSALLTFAFLAFVISSCAQPTGPASSGDNSFGGKPSTGGGSNTGGAKNPTICTITFSQNPVTVGEDVLVTGQVTSDSGIVVGGLFKFEYQDTTAGSPWIQVGADIIPDALNNGMISATLNFSNASVYNFRCHYMPEPGSAWGQSHLFQVPLYVGEVSCIGDIQLLPTLVAAEGASGNINFTLGFDVKACTAVHNAKLQGGLTAGATFTSASPSGYTTAMKKGTNTVVTWALGSLAEGFNGTYTVNFTKNMGTGLTPGQVAGSWSAKGFRDSDNLETINNYTGVILWGGTF